MVANTSRRARRGSAADLVLDHVATDAEEEGEEVLREGLRRLPDALRDRSSQAEAEDLAEVGGHERRADLERLALVLRVQPEVAEAGDHAEDRLDAEHHGEDGNEHRGGCRVAEASQEEEVLHRSADADGDAAAQPEPRGTGAPPHREAPARSTESPAVGKAVHVP